MSGNAAAGAQDEAQNNSSSSTAADPPPHQTPITPNPSSRDAPTSSTSSSSSSSSFSSSSAGRVARTWVRFAKAFVLVFPVYALGYLEFSVSWLLIGLAVVFFWRRNASCKSSRLSRALAFLHQQHRHMEEEERSSGAARALETTELPSWPLRVNGVKVYTENVDTRQIIMDLQISFVANTEIEMDIKRYYCKAGIKSIQLLDVGWAGLTNILDIPGLNGFSDSLIQDVISRYLVLPNRITVPLATVYEHSGQHLEIELFDEDPDKDDFLGSLMIDLTKLYKKQKVEESEQLDLHPDSSKHPYRGLLKVRYKTCEPIWDEAFTFLVHNPHTQELQVEVKDNKHKCMLGNMRVALARLIRDEDMSLVQQFPLSSSGPNSTLKLKLVLRILCLEKETTSGQPSLIRLHHTSQSVTMSQTNTTTTTTTTNSTPTTHSSSTTQSTSTTHTTPCSSPVPTGVTLRGKRGSEGSPVSLVQTEMQRDSPRRESKRRDSTRRDSTRRDSTRRDSTRRNSTRRDSTQRESTHRDSTQSLASDASLPSAALELQQRLAQLQK
ncbi:Extended synaptotagmin-2 [Bagarius yarrelli]|uniref:Extended synaptotagmin-2 n=1 Tax=Bagarius yarrelli TaxID=175774 RepID=A0A556VWF8_BAGYA|nr:Extended synaptotagmin-2 [Bagarius yarrelli]